MGSKPHYRFGTQLGRRGESTGPGGLGLCQHSSSSPTAASHCTSSSDTPSFRYWSITQSYLPQSLWRAAPLHHQLPEQLHQRPPVDQGHHSGKGPRHSPQERGRSLEASGGWDVLCPNLSWGIGMRQAGDGLLPGNTDPPGKVGVLPPTFSLFLVFVSGLEPHLAPRLSTGMMGGSQCGRRLPAPKSPMPPFHPAGH